MSDWLRRYQAGECLEVWAEMEACGPVQGTPVEADAVAVCDEFARRARHNLEVIAADLTSRGYEFTSIGFDEPATPLAPLDSAAQAAFADDLDQLVGPLPLVVLSWIRLVGDVWLVGLPGDDDDPEWPGDPFVFELGAVSRDLEQIRDEQRELQTSPDEPWPLGISPDEDTKANSSGGAPHAILVPCPHVDAIMTRDGHEPTSLATYVRQAIAGGGFWTPRPHGSRLAGLVDL
ncbi:MAG: hypothetical protein Q4G45_14125 [Actinomycetia bacterium]|nr:hypothetical protein [Actinomycetes bacterium]